MIKTTILDASTDNIIYCADLLKNGEVVAMPTETVYGLAANIFNDKAVSKIFEIKGRPQDNPLICHISNISMLDELTIDLHSEIFQKLIEKFWPGPLTVIVPRNKKVSNLITANLDTVAIRFPSHVVSRKLIEACGFPLAAPSANLSGKPSPTSANHVFYDLNGRIKAILDGGICEVGLESTIVKIEDDSLRVLRPGIISVDMLKEVTENIVLDDSVLNQIDPNSTVISPGTKYKHYSPNADIVLVDSSLDDFRTYVSDKLEENVWCAVFDGEQKCFDKNVLTFGYNEKDQAHNIFMVLRKFDELGASKVFFRCPKKENIGLAVYNRLLRAAAFNLVVL